MRLDDACLSEYFTLPTQDISHLQPGTNPFNFEYRTKDTLLVTIGDSWTWGDDLGINRKSEVFGYLLSNTLSTDFLNLSSPGAGNQYIHLLFTELVKVAGLLDYKKIIVIITFTEVGRDFNGWFDRTVDYSSWLRNNIKVSDDYNKLLAWLNSKMAESIKYHAQTINNLQLISATNFVNPIGLELLAESFVEKSWLDVYYETMFNQRIVGDCYFVSDFIFEKLIGVLDLHWGLDRNTYIKWANSNLELAASRLSYLKNDKFFVGLNHPNAQLHKIWADYLLEKINV